MGDHVVLSFRSCRECGPCREGRVGYCDQTLLLNYMGMRADGSTTMNQDGSPVFGSFFGQSSLARHALAHADNCVVVDPDLDLTLAAPYGCGFQTGAGTVLNVLHPGAHDSLVVYGVGAVGLAVVAAAVAEGVGTVLAVDLVGRPARRGDRLGATPVDASRARAGRGGRPGQGAHRRRGVDVRRRHHRGAGRGQAGPAGPGPAGHPGRRSGWVPRSTSSTRSTCSRAASG